MARISIDDVRAWVESSKLDPQALDLDHLDQLETEVLTRINSVYDTTGWLDKASTPRIVQVILAKTYAGWLYDKYYSENQGIPNQYSQLLKANAEMLIQGIIDGTIEIINVSPSNPVGPSFYPNDLSSAQEPTTDDPSLGPAKFSMGRLF